MLLLAALQLNILKRAKNHHFPNTEINNRVGDGTPPPWPLRLGSRDQENHFKIQNGATPNQEVQEQQS